jgi:hypothetical protein
MNFFCYTIYNSIFTSPPVRGLGLRCLTAGRELHPAPKVYYLVVLVHGIFFNALHLSDHYTKEKGRCILLRHRPKLNSDY